MLPLRQVVNANVSFGAAGHSAGQLFTHKEVRMVPQFFGTLYRVVIGKSEKIHAALAQQGVKLVRIAIAFAAKTPDERSSTRSRKVRMDM